MGDLDPKSPGAFLKIYQQHAEMARDGVVCFAPIELAVNNLKHRTVILNGTGVNANGLKLKIAPPKLFERAFEKVHGEYSGDYGKLTDVIRGKVECPDVQTMVAFVEELASTLSSQGLEPTPTGHVTVIRIKNKMSPEYDASKMRGYRNLHLNLMWERGAITLVFELQITLAVLDSISDRTHHIYETVRTYHLDKWELTTLVLGPSTDQARALRLVESGVICEVHAFCEITLELKEKMQEFHFALSRGDIKPWFSVWVRV